MSIRDEVRSLPAYSFTPRAAEVKLDQNEMPLDLPPEVRAAALERIAAAAFHRYPEIQAESLRERLAAIHGWPAAGVVVTGGSNVLIQVLVIAAALGRRVLTVTPNFSVYALQARLLGAELTELPLAPGFALPLAALRSELARGSGVLFVTNPAAPTGNRHPDADVEALVSEALTRGWTPVIDEAYAEFAGRDHRALLERYPGCVLLRTFSKALGLGGVRLGYALAAPELATELRKVVLPFSVSALQLAVGNVVLDAHELTAQRVATIRAERARVRGVLAGDPTYTAVTALPSDANFFLLRSSDPGALYEALAERGVLVRRQDHLPQLDGCLRVSIGTRNDNDAFLAALADALATGIAALPNGSAEGVVSGA